MKINKKILMFSLVGLFAVALISAGYYTMFSTTFTVTNPIQTTGEDYYDELDFTITSDMFGADGYTYLNKEQVVRANNNGNEERTVVITTTGTDENVEVNYVSKLVLEDKNSDTWVANTLNAKTADFYYFITGEEMGYHMEAVGLENSVDYKLIYYKDSGATDPTDGKPWNLDNAVEIASGTSDSSGNLVLEGSEEFGNDLPFDTDYNTNPDVGDSYCGGDNGFDDYLHCNGAKIWLITGDLELSNWNPDAWLFEENDLVHYFDNTDGSYTIDAGSFVEFYPMYEFDEYAEGDYTITTEVA